MAAEQRNLEEQQRREREAAAAAALRRNNERHECNANASPDVKQTLKVCFLTSQYNERNFKFIFRHVSASSHF